MRDHLTSCGMAMLSAVNLGAALVRVVPANLHCGPIILDDLARPRLHDDCSIEVADRSMTTCTIVCRIATRDAVSKNGRMDQKVGSVDITRYVIVLVCSTGPCVQMTELVRRGNGCLSRCSGRNAARFSPP
jgi:hypothetical protein